MSDYEIVWSDFEEEENPPLDNRDYYLLKKAKGVNHIVRDGWLETLCGLSLKGGLRGGKVYYYAQATCMTCGKLFATDRAGF